MFAEVDILKILHPSQTRWLSVAAVVKRILEQWSALQLFFNSKWLDARLMAAEQIHKDLNDPFIKVYFIFLNHVLPKITSLNQYFQSDKVVLSSLHTSISDTYKDLLLSYMERRYITENDMSEIDPNNRTWFLPKNLIYIGVDAVNELKKPIFIEHKHLLEHFYERCQLFYSVLCVQIKKRYDFNNFILPKMFIFLPKNAVSHNIRYEFPSLADIINNMPRFYNSGDQQLIDDQWRLLPNYNFQLDEIDINEEIDVFWGNLFKYKNPAEDQTFYHLASFVLNILSLPHSNAACERAFSKVNLIKTKTRNKLITTSVNGCLLASQSVKNDGDCIKFVPTKDMLSRMQKNEMYKYEMSRSQVENDFDDDNFVFESL